MLGKGEPQRPPSSLPITLYPYSMRHENFCQGLVWEESCEKQFGVGGEGA